jgi:hypothetical protein
VPFELDMVSELKSRIKEIQDCAADEISKMISYDDAKIDAIVHRCDLQYEAVAKDIMQREMAAFQEYVAKVLSDINPKNLPRA